MVDGNGIVGGSAEEERGFTPDLQRRRRPRPVLRRRLPSGRGATEQPNATGDVVPLTPMFWALLVATGAITGIAGGLLVLLLHAVQHAAFGYSAGDFLHGVDAASRLRIVVVLAVAGAVGGAAWYGLQRWQAGGSSDLDDAVWNGTGDLSFRRSAATAVMQEVIVGMGASLGREAAPKLMGAASGSLLARWRRLDPGQRRLLVACGGGAGMAAVYNVPLGGALITAELLYGSVTLPIVLPAIVCSAVATAVSWVVLPIRPTYVGVPAYHLHGAQLGFAVLAGPLIGVLSVGYVRLIGWVSYHRARGRWVLVAPLAVFVVLGMVAWRYPQLLGNGKDMVQQVFVATGGVSTLLMLALFTLKPLATALCLGSGVTGGLFTPTLATGATFGAFAGSIWTLLWPGAPVGSYAVIAAAAMLGAAMQTPLAALVLVAELTGTTGTIIVPMIVATALATAVARQLDGYSIYSSRLPAHERTEWRGAVAAHRAPDGGDLVTGRSSAPDPSPGPSAGSSTGPG